MPVENVEPVAEVASMERVKVIWTFNPITVGPILAAIIGGSIWAKSLEWRLNDNDSYKVVRAALVDKQIGTLFDVTKDLPYRMDQEEKATAAQIEKDKAQDARIDRQTDLILSGQDSMRTTMQAGFDGMRKDMGNLSTKVEVLGSKVDMANGKPTQGSYTRMQ